MKKLTYSEQSALQSIENNIDFFISNNLNTLAKHYNVGEATLIRLVKKLEFNSLKQMQIEYASKISLNNLTPIKDNSSKENINDNVSNFEIYSILETRKLVDLEIVNIIAKKIYNLKHISFFGIENSHISAQFLTNSLQRIGIHPWNHFSVHGAITSLTFIEPNNSLVIIFSSSGITKECVELAKHCLKLNIEFVWIGSNINKNKETILQKANYKLFHSYHKNETLRFPSISSYSGQLYIANLLFNTIINFDKSISEKLKNSNKTILNWNNSD